jgi:thymidine kinase
MNAGKSTALLQVAHNYEEQGQSVRLFTAAIDSRYGLGKVTSRLGPQRQVETFDAGTDFLADIAKVACVLVDEAQFLSTAQVQQLHQLAQVRGVPVICYGLRSDFRGEPFPGSAYLLALADDIGTAIASAKASRSASAATSAIARSAPGVFIAEPFPGPGTALITEPGHA